MNDEREKFKIKGKTTGSRTRTDTSLRTTDFESIVSTNFTMPAGLESYNTRRNGKTQEREMREIVSRERLGIYFCTLHMLAVGACKAEIPLTVMYIKKFIGLRGERRVLIFRKFTPCNADKDKSE